MPPLIFSNALAFRTFCSSANVHASRVEQGRQKNETFFQKNLKMAEKRKKDKPLILFLEGPPGSGKKEILTRLKKLDFTTVNLPFLPDLKEKDIVTATNEHNDLFQKQIQNLYERNKAGEKFHENVIFFNRSPLTGHIFSDLVQEDAPSKLHVLQALFNTYNCSIVLCVADTLMIQQRLTHRFDESDPFEREKRILLRETDFEYMEEKKQQYEELFEIGKWIDATLPSTDPKQAVVGLMKYLDINPPIFDLFQNKQDQSNVNAKKE